MAPNPQHPANSSQVPPLRLFLDPVLRWRHRPSGGPRCHSAAGTLLMLTGQAVPCTCRGMHEAQFPLPQCTQQQQWG